MAGVSKDQLKMKMSTETDSHLYELAKNGIHNDESFSGIRLGSQLDDKLEFKDKLGNVVSCCPVIVDFRRLLQLQNKSNPAYNNDVISGISNTDLLHAVVGLYDIALSEMTLDVLYSTVCEKWARTIVLVKDVEDAVKDVELKKKSMLSKSKEQDEDKNCDFTDSSEIGKDRYEEQEGEPSPFEAVFSDVEEDEDEEDEEEEDSDEEDFSKGIKTFIKCASKRRQQRKEKNSALTKEDIGVENRIVGCMTFEKKYVQRERVIHLTILTIRPRYRKFGIGKYLLTQVVDPMVAGQYEAVVVHADNGAVEFFQKFGFLDDVVLNSRWSELAEQFTNCTMMCYLPGFTGHTLLSTIKLPGLEVFEMEQELKKWKDKTLESYQAQISCIMRMKQEILTLQKKVKSQDEIINTLALQNQKIKEEKLQLEKELKSHKLLYKDGIKIDDDDINTNDLINQLENQINASSEDKTVFQNGCATLGSEGGVSLPVFHVRSEQEPYDHMLDAAFFYDITQQFREAMYSDPCIRIQFEVTSLNKCVLSPELKGKYQTHNQTLHDPTMVTRLYYCGGLGKPQRLEEIMKGGFSDEDFTHGEYGRGIYFSKYPSKAAQFSALGKLVIAEVGLGAVQTVTKTDRTRQQPADGYDSIIIPGRLYRASENRENMLNEEYVVFNSYQILPLCLINYESAKKDSGKVGRC